MLVAVVVVVVVVVAGASNGCGTVAGKRPYAPSIVAWNIVCQ